MKRVMVEIDGQNRVEVRLNRYCESDPLTPEMARAAVQIAGGVGAWGYAWDGSRHARVTAGVRLIKE